MHMNREISDFDEMLKILSDEDRAILMRERHQVVALLSSLELQLQITELKVSKLERQLTAALGPSAPLSNEAGKGAKNI